MKGKIDKMQKIKLHLGVQFIFLLNQSLLRERGRSSIFLGLTSIRLISTIREVEKICVLKTLLFYGHMIPISVWKQATDGFQYINVIH